MDCRWKKESIIKCFSNNYNCMYSKDYPKTCFCLVVKLQCTCTYRHLCVANFVIHVPRPMVPRFFFFCFFLRSIAVPQCVIFVYMHAACR